MTPTPRQIDVLRFVRDYTLRQRYAPTYDEIGHVLKMSKVTVFEHVANLMQRGLMRRDKHKARAIEITDDGRAALEPATCPHCGCAFTPAPSELPDRNRSGGANTRGQTGRTATVRSKLVDAECTRQSRRRQLANGPGSLTGTNGAGVNAQILTEQSPRFKEDRHVGIEQATQ